MKQPDQSLLQDVQRETPGIRNSIKTYLLRHAQVFFYSLGQLSRTPFALFMTVAVIGIALALPAGLHVLLNNAQQISGGWDGAAKLSLFLKSNVSDSQIQALQKKLERMPEIATVTYISRAQALAEFKKQSGFGEALTALQQNPLPAVLVVTPTLSYSDASQLEMLAKKLGKHKYVEVAQLDMQWVKRLYAIMDIVGRGVVVLGLMLAVAVLLIIGNTIRLAIQNRRDEIVIIKLIGGTDAFIRRPFLYTGFWYGLFGGIIAVLLISVSLWILSAPVERLAGLYQTPIIINTLGLEASLILIILSITLGLLGSWVAVSRHLRSIEPS